MDKEDIITVARKIGTFDTSIEPYEDCCTVFTPKHPKTRPVLEKLLVEEAKIDFETLENEAFETLNTVVIKKY
jgi:thiamine biosynthesis protein ThiI